MKKITVGMLVCCWFCLTWLSACDDGSDPVFEYQEFQWLEEVGVKLYAGDAPPNIQGSYALNSLKIDYDDKNLDHVIYDYTYSFAEQNGDSIKLSYSSPEAGDNAQDIAANISGSGNCFSVVVYVKGTSNGCKYTMPQIISGCLAQGGIGKWQLGIIMGEKSGTNCDQMLEEDHRRVIVENDGLAQKVSR